MNLTQEQIVQFKKAIDDKNYYFVYRLFIPQFGKIVRSEDNKLLYVYNKCNYELLEESAIRDAMWEFLVKPEIDCPEKIRIRVLDEVVKIILDSPEYSKVKMDSYEDYLFFKNGALNFVTGEFITETSGLFNTSYINCDYKPETLECPYFDEFLGQIFLGDNEPDKNQINKEWMKLGYWLYPQHKMEKIFIYVGTSAANGKSVYFDFIASLFQKEFVSFTSLNAITKSNSLERTSLINARLNIGQEFETDYLQSAELKKAISGQELEINRKYLEPINISPQFKILVALNKMPEFSDKTYAITRRLDITEMNARFVPLEEYQKLKNPLIQKTFLMKEKKDILASFEEEKSAIANKAIKALKELRELKWQLPVSESNIEILEEFTASNSPIMAFLQERYEPCDELIKQVGWERVLSDMTEAEINVAGETLRQRQMKIAQEIKKAFNVKSKLVRNGGNVGRKYPLTIKPEYCEMMAQKSILDN